MCFLWRRIAQHGGQHLHFSCVDIVLEEAVCGHKRRYASYSTVAVHRCFAAHSSLQRSSTITAAAAAAAAALSVAHQSTKHEHVFLIDQSRRVERSPKFNMAILDHIAIIIFITVH